MEPGDASDTCWTVIHGAAEGEAAQRTAFVRLYAPVIRAYLLARWRTSPLRQDVDDVVQEVFLTCFRDGGALARLDPERASGFRPFLYGVIRNVALQTETKRNRSRESDAESAVLNGAATDEDLAVVFDRAWARSVVQDAIARMENRRDVALLQARFADDLPIREIAKAWRCDPARLHRDYARARAGFRNSLVSVIRFHQPDATPDAALDEARRLLGLLE